MKANRVLKILDITRVTLSKYVKSGKLRVTALPNGDYDYDEESVAEAKNGFKKRDVAIYFGNIDDSMKIECEKVVQQFVKENMDVGEHVEVYHDENGTRGSEFKRLINDALGFRLKKIAVLDADLEVMNALSMLEMAFANGACHLELLGCCPDDGQWGNESEEDLLMFVRRMKRGTKDQRLREKLECIERILRM